LADVIFKIDRFFFNTYIYHPSSFRSSMCLLNNPLSSLLYSVMTARTKTMPYTTFNPVHFHRTSLKELSNHPWMVKTSEWDWIPEQNPKIGPMTIPHFIFIMLAGQKVCPKFIELWLLYLFKGKGQWYQRKYTYGHWVKQQ
jgi:hypothetical protein